MIAVPLRIRIGLRVVGGDFLAEVFEAVEGEVVGVVGSLGAAEAVVVGGAGGDEQVVTFDDPVGVLERVPPPVGVMQQLAP